MRLRKMAAVTLALAIGLLSLILCGVALPLWVLGASYALPGILIITVTIAGVASLVLMVRLYEVFFKLFDGSSRIKAGVGNDGV
jgi:hypothetical protein